MPLLPGTPADAVDFGPVGLMKEAAPDLVISGVNDGPNTGMAQVNSDRSALQFARVHGFRRSPPASAIASTEQEMKTNGRAPHKYRPIRRITP